MNEHAEIVIGQGSEIIFANSGAMALFGRAPEAMLHEFLFNMLLPESIITGAFWTASPHHPADEKTRAIGIRDDSTVFAVDIDVISFGRAEGQTKLYLHEVHSFDSDGAARLRLSSGVFRTAADKIRRDERMRISHELHDDLGQCLCLIRMALARMRSNPYAGVLVDDMSRLDYFLAGATAALRNEICSLQDQSPLKQGLKVAIEDMIVQISNVAPISITLLCDGDLSGLRQDIVASIFRVIQEALTNILRHANATETIVRISRGNARIVVSVSDNGRGFRQADLGKFNSFGINSIQRRVDVLNGTVTLRPALPAGTTLEVQLPLNID